MDESVDQTINQSISNFYQPISIYSMTDDN